MLRSMFLGGCLLLLAGCGPVTTGAIGVVGGVYGLSERSKLEKRIEALEQQAKQQKNCLLLCDYPVKRR